jgi:hypothetical protein
MKTFIQLTEKHTNPDIIDKLKHPIKLDAKRLEQLKGDYSAYEDIAFEQWQGYPFPKNSSNQTFNELKTLISLGQFRTEWEEEMIMYDTKVLKPFKDYAETYGIEVDFTRIKSLMEQTQPILLALKGFYNRPRPSVLAAKLGLSMTFFPLKTSKTPSYPSGHATQGHLVSLLVADELPLEHRRNVLKIGKRIGESRQIAGAHYPSDTVFGIELGDEFYRLSKTSVSQETDLTLESIMSENFLLEGTTTASTYFEQVIVACANSKSLEQLKADPGYISWLAKTDKKWKTDDKTVEKFRKQVRKISTSGSSAGQGSGATSDLWKTVTGKSNDISKADVKLGTHQVSVKGPDARLMSGVKTESLATLYAAFETIDVSDLGLGLEDILKGFVSRVKTEGAEFNSATLKKQDPKTLSANNKKAFNDLQKQMDVKKLAEVAFKKAFASGQGEFARAFAWEAMTGEKKFVSNGVANAMLVWPYDLRSVVFHPNLSLNGPYVSKVAKEMKFSAGLKSSRISKKIAGVSTKTGYTINQTVGLAMKTAESEFDAAQTESVNESLQLENMLMEGKIDEGKFTDMLKGIWQRLKTAIKGVWDKLLSILSGLLTQLTNAIKGGMNHLLWQFEFEPTVRVKTTGIKW